MKAKNIVDRLLETEPSGLEPDDERNPLETDPDDFDPKQAIRNAVLSAPEVAQKLFGELVERDWRRVRVEAADSAATAENPGREVWVVRAEVIDVPYRTYWEFQAGARVAPEPSENSVMTPTVMRQFNAAARRAGLKVTDAKLEALEPAHGAVDVHDWQQDVDLEDQSGDWSVEISFTFDIYDQHAPIKSGRKPR